MKGASRKLAKEEFVRVCEANNLAGHLATLLNFFSGARPECQYQKFNYEGGLGSDYSKQPYIGYRDAIAINNVFLLDQLNVAYALTVQYKTM